MQPAHALSDAWQVLGKLELFGDLNETNKNPLRYWSEQVLCVGLTGFEPATT